MSGGSVTGNQLLDTGLMIAAGVAAPELALAAAPEMFATAGGAALATGIAGAGTSALAAGITGKDVGKAALMGGIGGGLGGYISGGNAAESLGANSNVTPSETIMQPSAVTNPTPLQQGYGLDANQYGLSNVGANPATTSVPSVSNYNEQGLSDLINKQSNISNIKDAYNAAGTGTGTWSGMSNLGKAQTIGSGILGANALLEQPKVNMPQSTTGGVPAGLDYKFDRNTYQPSIAPYYNGMPNNYQQEQYAKQKRGYADGGTVEQMSRENAMGNNQMFPQAGLGGLTGMNSFQNATNTPMGTNVIEPTDAVTDPYTGQMKFARGGITSPSSPTAGTYQNTSLNLPTVKEYMSAATTPMGLKQLQIAAQNGDYNAQFALNNLQGGSVQDISAGSQMPEQTAAQGGIMGYARGGDLGSYSDGGRMLRGPGDGMSDDIPAQIGSKQPARLADGEFVVPADVVSHLGNGSTDAGAKHLYSMMDKVRSARTGRKAQGKQIKPEKYLPA